MSKQEEKTLREKEKQLRKLEHDSIKEKAQFIMTHSDALLEKIENGDENFLKSFVAFLMSNSNNDFEMNYESNEYDYAKSLSVIFEVCFALPSLGFDANTRKDIRNKIRIYTKYFNTSYEVEAKTNNQFVLIDLSAYQYIIKR